MNGLENRSTKLMFHAPSAAERFQGATKLTDGRKAIFGFAGEPSMNRGGQVCGNVSAVLSDWDR